MSGIFGWIRGLRTPTARKLLGYIACVSVMVGTNLYFRHTSADAEPPPVAARQASPPSQPPPQFAAPLSLPPAPVAVAAPTVASPASHRTDAVRNLSAMVQMALSHGTGPDKSRAAWEINRCRTIDKDYISGREDAERVGVSWVELSKKFVRWNAECQTLTRQDFASVKELAIGAYQLKSDDGAYLYAKEVGIPQDPIEKKFG